MIVAQGLRKSYGAGTGAEVRALDGIDAPSSGSVVIDGECLTAMDDTARTRFRQQRLGFVFQAYNLLPALTVEENVALPLLIARGRLTEPEHRRVAGLMSALDLTKRRRHLSAQLSGGQQQRVAIARALVNRPSAIFLDEPTGALDSRTGEQVLALLRAVHEERHATLVMVTHNVQAAEYADRIVFLKDGRVRDELYKSELRTDVARFGGFRNAGIDPNGAFPEAIHDRVVRL